MKKLSVNFATDFNANLSAEAVDDIVKELVAVNRDSGAKRYFLRNVHAFVKNGFEVEIDYKLDSAAFAYVEHGSLINKDWEPVAASRDTFKARLVFAMQLGDELDWHFNAQSDRINNLIDSVHISESKKLVFKFKPMGEENYKDAALAGAFISGLAKMGMPNLKTEANVNKYLTKIELKHNLAGAFALNNVFESKGKLQIYDRTETYQLVSGKSGKVLVLVPHELNARMIQAFYAAAKHEGSVSVEKFTLPN